MIEQEKTFFCLNPPKKARLSASINRGFTLVELLVVISITILLSTLVLANYRGGESQLALQRSANKLAQDVRRAEEMAMSAKEHQGNVPPGYGIYLEENNNYYLLYADIHENEKYDGADQIVEEIYLESKVYIKDVQPASLSINFKPPDPEVKISGQVIDDANLATIILSLKTDSTKEKIIKVNKAGLIYVE